MFVIPCAPCLEYPIENLTHGRLYPYQMIVPKFKSILFGFHTSSRFIAKVTFASIPSNIETCRMHIFLYLVGNLQTLKTRISFLGIAFKVSMLSIPLTDSFRNQELEKITKNTVYFLPIKIGKINSSHCLQNKEKRVLNLFCRLILISAPVVAYSVG